jgi:hypothetical protein
MDNLYLVYINRVGQNWKGDYIFEFLFSDVTENIDGDGWDAYPASNNPEPPENKFIKKVGTLTSNLNFDLVSESDSFAIWDAVDGVVSLAWENITEYEEYPDSRIHFRFGENLDSVEDKLYEKDHVLSYDKILKNKVKNV